MCSRLLALSQVNKIRTDKRKQRPRQRAGTSQCRPNPGLEDSKRLKTGRWAAGSPRACKRSILGHTVTAKGYIR